MQANLIYLLMLLTFSRSLRSPIRSHSRKMSAEDSLQQVNKKGAFTRSDAFFRNFVSKDSERYPPAADRYVLIVNNACPWANRYVVWGARIRCDRQSSLDLSEVRGWMLHNCLVYLYVCSVVLDISVGSVVRVLTLNATSRRGCGDVPCLPVTLCALSVVCCRHRYFVR